MANNFQDKADFIWIAAARDLSGHVTERTELKGHPRMA